jgi:hypothetical protein
LLNRINSEEGIGLFGEQALRIRIMVLYGSFPERANGNGPFREHALQQNNSYVGFVPRTNIKHAEHEKEEPAE